MNNLATHWTEVDVESYAFRIAFDFVTYVSVLLESGRSSQAELAQALGVSESRVSQILNNPGNLTLKQVVKVARALGRKVSIVPYDDGDATNQNGPINGVVFTRCWELAGRPSDFLETSDARKLAEMRDRAVTSAKTIPRRDFAPMSEGLTFVNGGSATNAVREMEVRHNSARTTPRAKLQAVKA